MSGYNAVYATGWYTATAFEVLEGFGNYSKMVYNGYHMFWDAADNRYVVRS